MPEASSAILEPHTQTNSDAPKSDSKTGRVHLAYLDGIRGIAALYVVLHHVYRFLTSSPAIQVPRALTDPLRIFAYGQFAVVVFIVLSGYCLMMPVVRSNDLGTMDAVWTFFKRRAMRILPAYYAVIVFTIALVMLVHSMRSPIGTLWDVALPVLGLKNLIGHAILIHDLFPHIELNIDPPLWSIGVEWQIYFVFALALLPIWRAKGIGWCMAAAAIIGITPAYFGLSGACPWFVVLFTMGMAAAIVGFDSKSDHAKIADRPWYFWSAIVFAAKMGVSLLLQPWQELHRPTWEVSVDLLDDLLGGASATCFLIGTTARLQAKRPLTGLAAFAASKAPVWLGACSYSLYLIHYPLQAAIVTTLVTHHCSGELIALSLFAGVPVICLAAFGFYLLFERPYLRSRMRAATMAQT